jgi:hypothetical protein
MRPRPSLPCGPLAAVAAVLAAFPALHASAGVIGKDASLLWTGNGLTVDQKSFVIDDDAVEYSWTTEEPGGPVGFTIDLNEKGLRLVFSGEPLLGSPVAFTFGTDALMHFDMEEDVRFDLALVASNALVTGLSQSDAAWSGRRLTLDLSGVELSGPGATFTVEYYTSPVPAPGAFALLALAAGTAGARRRRP